MKTTSVADMALLLSNLDFELKAFEQDSPNAPQIAGFRERLDSVSDRYAQLILDINTILPASDRNDDDDPSPAPVR